jgi:hypothetical protein
LLLGGLHVFGEIFEWLTEFRRDIPDQAFTPTQFALRLFGTDRLQTHKRFIAFAMMTSSPSSALRINFERCVFA